MDQTTTQILDELWSTDKVQIPVENRTFEAQVRLTGKRKNLIDIILTEEERKIGFITLALARGNYNIINYPHQNPHGEGFRDYWGIGLEVREEYTGAHIGCALLSLGIGYAQRHFKYESSFKKFRTVAPKIIPSADHIYVNFGFLPPAKDPTSRTKYYTDPETVRNLHIKLPSRVLQTANS